MSSRPRVARSARGLSAGLVQKKASSRPIIPARDHAECKAQRGGREKEDGLHAALERCRQNGALAQGRGDDQRKCSNVSPLRPRGCATFARAARAQVWVQARWGLPHARLRSGKDAPPLERRGWAAAIPPAQGDPRAQRWHQVRGPLVWRGGVCVRRGGVQHGHGRLPRGPHRPLVPRPAPHVHVPPHRQLWRASE